MPNPENPVTRRSRLSTNTVLTLVVLLAAAVVFGGVLLFNGSKSDGADGTRSGGSTVAADVLRKPDSNTLLDKPGAEVTIVEFLDYQCPACAGYYKKITKKLEEDYAGRITFVTRNFPLDMHPLAVPAARAAEAAALQGKYREMYHELYDNYLSWARTADGSQASADLNGAQARFDEFARRIGLDLDRFHRDLNSETVTQRIERDRADGRRAGVSGTPTIFVNGSEFSPSGETFADVEEQLREQIEQELAR
ncbi:MULTISPECIES: DsbA family protein [Prauserella salsuginis group]|uniref:Protein-disulfide isomerase n=2 Tax=Prauserella salsuginis group TaxID=2893672 RepID=A0A839XUC8_9PSEU|nr:MULTISPECIES: thioredoxin domain-containing protein [Prauserella salsuginis group]MBB3663616.1 protein-disulfide isomerase [Prauserella sediminis]MCR3722602.1 Protein-disulfide isomerase [Prauserella flava]MCR3737044.1 Protein-disulfide isomerase [Prauserella salsuginis]